MSSAPKTRSRSASSASTSSTSSSSGSSGSSSDDSSSGSGTEASRASSQESRTSRASLRLKGVTAPVVANNEATSTSSTVKNLTPAQKKTVSSTTNSNGLSSSHNKSRQKSKATSSATSSNTESDSTTSTPIKKVSAKPAQTTKKSSTAGSSTATSSSKNNKILSGSVTNSVKAPPKSSSSLKQKSLKSIFSPGNSSENSDVDSKKRNPSISSGLKKKKGDVTKSTPSNSNIKKPLTSPSPKSPRVFSSTSLSASTTSNSNSSSSSSDSEKITEKKEINLPPSRKQSVSPKLKKRPLTRTQRKKDNPTTTSKTIPTTTLFNHSSLQTQPSATWDSDFSDDPRTLRVPAKTNQKAKKQPPVVPVEEEEAEYVRTCPYKDCDSIGHLSGKYPTHTLLSTCPRYHDLEPEECKENADKREKRTNERKKYYQPNLPHQPQLKKPSKLSPDAKSWLVEVKELKNTETPDGLTSEYDYGLFLDGLAEAASRIEAEQLEGISRFSVCIGKYEMTCWCMSPYPEPLCHNRRLFVCEFCLKPVQSGTVLRRHCSKCVWRHPPGDEIYRKDRLSVWEVDGKRQKTYCQYLCLLAKCFLDHKTLYLDVDPFLFYVMTAVDSQGCHLVGYFSKEKNSFLNYNVSCILTLPPFQRKGYGRLLIDFSYLLTRVEGKMGSPEKPLSDLGLISYRSYWKDAVLRRMCACASGLINVKDLSVELGVSNVDLISTLQFLGMLKYWKGKHIILKKQDVLEEYLERVRKRGDHQRQIDPSYLRWRPFQIENPS